MMALKPGTNFATHYEVVRVISAGGMGIVYEVLHKETKRRRALKVMLPHVLTDPLMRERFALEAVVTAEIESDHLVEVFDAGIDAETDCPFLVMELLRGEDLAARLRRGERFSAKETVMFLEQAALALEKTHKRGIVHRDLKPENLYLTERDDGSPRIKICDFGIAKVIKSTSAGGPSTTKSFGTPYYMSREQITGEANLIGPATDLYAIAQIAFSMLVGSPYFDDEASAAGNNVLTLLLAVGKGPAEPACARALRRGVELPAAFGAWFDRATRPTPSERFQSARPMVEELKAVLQEPVRVLGTGSPVAVAATPMTSSGAGGDGAVSVPLALGGTVPIPLERSAQSVRPQEAYQTGDAQSVPRPSSQASEPRGPVALRWAALGMVAALVGGGAIWMASRERSSTPTATGADPGPPSADATGAVTNTPTVTALSPSPLVTTASAQPAGTPAPADTGSAIAASASASASVRVGPRIGPRTTGTGKTSPPPPPPIWETR